MHEELNVVLALLFVAVQGEGASGALELDHLRTHVGVLAVVQIEKAHRGGGERDGGVGGGRATKHVSRASTRLAHRLSCIRSDAAVLPALRPLCR